jgi:hypothetical protein
VSSLHKGRKWVPPFTADWRKWKTHSLAPSIHSFSYRTPCVNSMHEKWRVSAGRHVADIVGWIKSRLISHKAHVIACFFVLNLKLSIHFIRSQLRDLSFISGVLSFTAQKRVRRQRCVVEGQKTWSKITSLKATKYLFRKGKIEWSRGCKICSWIVRRFNTIYTRLVLLLAAVCLHASARDYVFAIWNSNCVVCMQIERRMPRYFTPSTSFDRLFAFPMTFRNLLHFLDTA